MYRPYDGGKLASVGTILKDVKLSRYAAKIHEILLFSGDRHRRTSAWITAAYLGSRCSRCLKFPTIAEHRREKKNWQHKNEHGC